ncbi:MAG: hypothetical protein N2C12_17015, partial [Planctomycetales bacterium]
MLAQPGGRGTLVHTPAKLNLYFELLARRADGYHDVETLMVPISLCDTLYFKSLPAPSSGDLGELKFACDPS